jgi:hypothetical protein
MWSDKLILYTAFKRGGGLGSYRPPARLRGAGSRERKWIHYCYTLSGSGTEEALVKEGATPNTEHADIPCSVHVPPCSMNGLHTIDRQTRYFVQNVVSLRICSKAISSFDIGTLGTPTCPGSTLVSRLFPWCGRHEDNRSAESWNGELQKQSDLRIAAYEPKE